MTSRWQDKWFRGHVSWGPLTVYGANAMHWALNLKTPWGYLCFHPTTRTFGTRWPWSLYLSRDATPSIAAWAFGPGVDRQDKMALLLRRHGYCHCLFSNFKEGCPSEIHATYRSPTHE